jgi:hypothetical protein
MIFLYYVADDAPPTILVRVPAGSASVEPDGELAVFPGSIVHLECVFARKLGNPEWSWSSNFRQYLTGKNVFDSNAFCGLETHQLCLRAERE